MYPGVTSLRSLCTCVSKAELLRISVQHFSFNLVPLMRSYKQKSFFFYFVFTLPVVVLIRMAIQPIWNSYLELLAESRAAETCGKGAKTLDWVEKNAVGRVLISSLIRAPPLFFAFINDQYSPPALPPFVAKPAAVSVICLSAASF